MDTPPRRASIEIPGTQTETQHVQRELAVNLSWRYNEVCFNVSTHVPRHFTNYLPNLITAGFAGIDLPVVWDPKQFKWALETTREDGKKELRKLEDFLNRLTETEDHPVFTIFLKMDKHADQILAQFDKFLDKNCKTFAARLFTPEDLKKGMDGSDELFEWPTLGNLKGKFILCLSCVQPCDLSTNKKCFSEYTLSTNYTTEKLPRFLRSGIIDRKMLLSLSNAIRKNPQDITLCNFHSLPDHPSLFAFSIQSRHSLPEQTEKELFLPRFPEISTVMIDVGFSATFFKKGLEIQMLTYAKNKIQDIQILNPLKKAIFTPSAVYDADLGVIHLLFVDNTPEGNLHHAVFFLDRSTIQDNIMTQVHGKYQSKNRPCLQMMADKSLICSFCPTDPEIWIGICPPDSGWDGRPTLPPWQTPISLTAQSYAEWYFTGMSFLGATGMSSTLAPTMTVSGNTVHIVHAGANSTNLYHVFCQLLENKTIAKGCTKTPCLSGIVGLLSNCQLQSYQFSDKLVFVAMTKNNFCWMISRTSTDELFVAKNEHHFKEWYFLGRKPLPPALHIEGDVVICTSWAYHSDENPAPPQRIFTDQTFQKRNSCSWKNIPINSVFSDSQNRTPTPPSVPIRIKNRLSMSSLSPSQIQTDEVPDISNMSNISTSTLNQTSFQMSLVNQGVPLDPKQIKKIKVERINMDLQHQKLDFLQVLLKLAYVNVDDIETLLKDIQDCFTV